MATYSTGSLLQGLNNFSLGDYKQQMETPSLLGASVGVNGLNFSNDLQDGVFANNSSFDFSLSNPVSGTGNPTFWQSFAGYKDQQGNQVGGWGSTAFDVLKSGLGFYLGSQQLSQAEDALAENKRQFNLNYNAQKDLINDQLQWQYQARKDRNAANAGTLTQIS